jgi:hypothetical protein
MAKFVNAAKTQSCLPHNFEYVSNVRKKTNKKQRLFKDYNKDFFSGK